MGPQKSGGANDLRMDVGTKTWEQKGQAVGGEGGEAFNGGGRAAWRLTMRDDPALSQPSPAANGGQCPPYEIRPRVHHVGRALPANSDGRDRAGSQKFFRE